MIWSFRGQQNLTQNVLIIFYNHSNEKEDFNKDGLIKEQNSYDSHFLIEYKDLNNREYCCIIYHPLEYIT